MGQRLLRPDYLGGMAVKNGPETYSKPPSPKHDNGKPLAALPFSDFPDAIKALVDVATFGANKYSPSGWKTVPNGVSRYENAMARHFLASFTEQSDSETDISHLAHLAWNALALLQLKLEETK
jgi:hypothetical protein